MAKKLVLMLLFVTIFACSSISIYAADTTKNAANVTGKEKASEKTVRYKKGLAAYIRKTNPNVGKKKSLNMAGLFISKGKKYDLDPKFLAAVAQRESTFKSGAYNGAGEGCRGLMQISTSLSRSYGYKKKSMYNMAKNIEVGAKYLRSLKDEFGTYTKTYAAYAYGPGNVRRGNYSTKGAKQVLKTRKQIRTYLKKNGYI